MKTPLLIASLLLGQNVWLQPPPPGISSTLDTPAAGTLTLCPANCTSISTPASFTQTQPKGATFATVTGNTTLTFPGGGAATEATSGPIVPAGATLVGYSARVVVAGTTCTSWEMGDGTTAARYCPSGTALTQGTLCTPANSATAAAIPDWAASGTGRNFTITAVGSNCVNLSVRITYTYQQSTADTAN